VKRKLGSLAVFTHTGLALLLGGGLVWSGAGAPAAHAAVLSSAPSSAAVPAGAAAEQGEEGVYISGSSYFTLSEASLSSSSLQFAVALHNGDSRSIDFNAYGVRVTDGAGRSYTAQLSEKKSALVAPGQDVSFRYYANLGGGIVADQLQIELFRWDSGEADFMKTLGQLAVAPAVAAEQTAAPQRVVNLHTVDATLASDAAAALALEASVPAYENGQWYIYTQLAVTNLGSASFKLPAALQLRLQAADGLQYAAEIVGEASPTLLPHETALVTVRTAVAHKLPESGLALQLYYVKANADVLLASLDAGGSLAPAPLGGKLTLPGQGDDPALTVTLSRASYTTQADGVHVQAVVSVENDSDAVAALPELSGVYQFGAGGAASVTATDRSARDAYVPGHGTAAYYLNAVLPPGTDPAQAKLALWASGSEAAAAAAGTAASASSAASGPSTPVGVFALDGIAAGASAAAAAMPYKLGDALAISAKAGLHPNLQLALVELSAHQNDDLGYRTAVAKFKVTNSGGSALALPDLQTELLDSHGNAFTGTRQTAAAAQVGPGASYVVAYTYLLPDDEQDDELVLNLFDDQAVSADSLSFGAYRVALQPEMEASGDTVSLYPFAITFLDSSVGWTYSNGTYAYRINLDLDIRHEDQVIVDSHFSQAEFDLVDAYGRVLGSQTASFTGAGKLVSGRQTIAISGIKSEQMESGVTVRMYEVIDTPNGSVKRLVQQL